MALRSLVTQTKPFRLLSSLPHSAFRTQFLKPPCPGLSFGRLDPLIIQSARSYATRRKDARDDMVPRSGRGGKPRESKATDPVTNGRETQRKLVLDQKHLMDLVNKPDNGLDPGAKRLALKALEKNPDGKITLEVLTPVSKETHTAMVWAASMGNLLVVLNLAIFVIWELADSEQKQWMRNNMTITDDNVDDERLWNSNLAFSSLLHNSIAGFALCLAVPLASTIYGRNLACIVPSRRVAQIVAFTYLISPLLGYLVLRTTRSDRTFEIHGASYYIGLTLGFSLLGPTLRPTKRLLTVASVWVATNALYIHDNSDPGSTNSIARIALVPLGAMAFLAARRFRSPLRR